MLDAGRMDLELREQCQLGQKSDTLLKCVAIMPYRLKTSDTYTVLTLMLLIHSSVCVIFWKLFAELFRNPGVSVHADFVSVFVVSQSDDRDEITISSHRNRTCLHREV